MKRNEIIEILENSYSGIETLRYHRRYENGDNKLKNIHWLMDNFDCSYGIAKRLVERANNFSDWK